MEKCMFFIYAHLPAALKAGVFFFICLAVSGCSSTRLVTIPDCADAVNIRKDTTVHHYFWGLIKAADIDPSCDRRYNHLNMVTVKTKAKNTLITVFTLGIVIPQTLSWCCAPYNPTPGTIGNH